MLALNRRETLMWLGTSALCSLSARSLAFAETPSITAESIKDIDEGGILYHENGLTIIKSDIAIDAAIDEIKSLPFEGVGIISGKVDYSKGFSKLQRLDIAPRANFAFLVKRDVNAVYLVAKEVFIQNPPTLADISNITFKLIEGLSGQPQPKAKNGRSWRVDWWDDNGEHGGNGEDGYPGNPGLSYDAPTIYFVFQSLTIQNATPETSTVLQFSLDGPNGGNGGRGGDGGDGGNGATGTPARDKWTLGVPSCRSGPGRGGNSGKPGSGGRGGDAGNGGNGGDVVIICPASEASKLAFAASFQPGQKGVPGQPGMPGRRGGAGSGGNLSTACRNGRPGGQVIAENPRDYGPGNEASDGLLGGYYVLYRDNSDLFPF